MSKFGIDVSEHQGVIDWEKVKPQIDFAILRVGYGDDIASQDDKQFIRNADECTRLGIPFGVYIYSYALTKEQIKSEVSHTIRQIKGYKLSYPVYFDIEDSSQSDLSNSTLADFSATFCDMIQSFGYVGGVYSFLNWWDNKLTDVVFDKYERWVAQFNSSITKSQYAKAHSIWQYTSTGRINGIDGNVDCNYCYVDYPSITNSNENIVAKETPKPINEQVDVTYQTYTAGRWLSNVKNLEDYAGLYGQPVQCIYANTNKGYLQYRVHTINGIWLPWVVDREDYAGIFGENIDGVQMQLLELDSYSVKYKAYVGGRWLSWVLDIEDYAGIYGQAIEGIQIQIISK